MIAFIAAAAVLTLATLAIMLRPAFARVDGARFTGSRRTFAAIAVAVPLAAVSLYVFLGERAALSPQEAVAAAADPEVQKMVATLAARLERDPSDTKGWVMLARSYKVMGRLQDAEAAYDHAAKGIAGDAQELAAYADIAASNAKGLFAGKPAQLVEQALRADPQNPMALWLAGAAALQSGDGTGGVAIWRKLLALLPPDSDDARELSTQILQAGGTLPAAAAPNPAQAVSGKVELAPGMQAAPGDVVFIVAKAAGQRVPVAVIRTTVSQLPFAFTLDDTKSMSPELRISSVPQVEVQARIARSGDPIAQPGDLVSDAQPVRVGSDGVVLRISRAR